MKFYIYCTTKGVRYLPRSRPKSKRKSFMATILPLVSLLMSFAMIFYIDAKIRPIIKSVASYQARLLVVRYINNSILEVIEQEHITSSDIVKITVGDNGVVSSLQTDMVSINKLKADITTAISEDLSTLKTQTINIPLGNLLGVQFFSGRGPKVAFDVIPSSFVQTRFSNEFLSAGINQTIHRLNIEITTSVMAITPGYTSTTEVTADFCIAETVIVGVVPEAFTKVITGETFDPGIINDFGAELRQ